MQFILMSANITPVDDEESQSSSYSSSSARSDDDEEAVRFELDSSTIESLLNKTQVTSSQEVEMYYSKESEAAPAEEVQNDEDAAVTGR